MAITSIKIPVLKFIKLKLANNNAHIIENKKEPTEPEIVLFGLILVNFFSL